MIKRYAQVHHMGPSIAQSAQITFPCPCCRKHIRAYLMVSEDEDDFEIIVEKSAKK